MTGSRSEKEMLKAAETCRSRRFTCQVLLVLHCLDHLLSTQASKRPAVGIVRLPRLSAPHPYIPRRAVAVASGPMRLNTKYTSTKSARELCTNEQITANATD